MFSLFYSVPHLWSILREQKSSPVDITHRRGITKGRFCDGCHELLLSSSFAANESAMYNRKVCCSPLGLKTSTTAAAAATTIMVALTSEDEKIFVPSPTLGLALRAILNREDHDVQDDDDNNCEEIQFSLPLFCLRPFFRSILDLWASGRLLAGTSSICVWTFILSSCRAFASKPTQWVPEVWREEERESIEEGEKWAKNWIKPIQLWK